MVTSKEYKKAFTFGATLTKPINAIHGGDRNFNVSFVTNYFLNWQFKRTRGKIP